MLDNAQSISIPIPSVILPKPIIHFISATVTPQRKVSPCNMRAPDRFDTKSRNGYKFIYQIGLGGFSRVWKV